MRCRISLRPLVIGALALILAPSVAHAQSTIAGVVKDTSGAVLPGVTVEAASPVLIEKTRSVITNGEGRYAIVDIRPGTYTVTFTLTGFNTFKREGVEVPTNVSVPINAEMKVGALEETVTVSGASPVVDVQNTAKVQRHEPRSHRHDSQRAQHAVGRRAGARRPAEHSRRRRRAADRADLHGDARQRGAAQHRAARRHAGADQPGRRRRCRTTSTTR